MREKIKHLIKNIDNIDIVNICSAWQWKIEDSKSVILVSCFGDMFLIGKDNCIYWLRTDDCELTKVAENILQFDELLYDDEKIANWFFVTSN
jgi:hypothetical protein